MFSVSVFDINTASPIFQESASKVTLPGQEGELCILDFHQPIVSCLKQGTIKIDNNNISISKGVASMQGDNLAILVER